MRAAWERYLWAGQPHVSLSPVAAPLPGLMPARHPRRALETRGTSGSGRSEQATFAKSFCSPLSTRHSADGEEARKLIAGLHSGPPSEVRGTPSPPAEDAELEVDAQRPAMADDEDEEEFPEWADPEFIAANGPSNRTRGGIARSEAESRGLALRTRRATGGGDKLDAVSAGRSGAAQSAADPLPGGIRKVLVIGAGYAGISAARTLTDLGYTVDSSLGAAARPATAP